MAVWCINIAGSVVMVQMWVWADIVLRVMIVFTVLFAAGAVLLPLQFPSTGRPGDGEGALSLGDKAWILLSLGLMDLIAVFGSHLVTFPRPAGDSMLKFVAPLAAVSLVSSVTMTVFLLLIVLPVAVTRPDVDMTAVEHTFVFGTH